MARNSYPSPISPLPSFPKPTSGDFTRQPTSSPSSSSDGKISPVVLLIIVILALIFFFCGVLHLLFRLLMKRPYFYLFSRFQRNPDNTTSGPIQRQLQQLFRLHDCGLDQAIIDSLPVFCYKDIVGLKEPFDCAVCLCEFSDHDNLRLLPDCSHAFHITCIDTWLLTNSTCPLCRGSLDNHLLSLDYFMEFSNGHQSNETGSGRFGNQKPTIMEESASERRVFSVRLGKFRSVLNEGVESGRIDDHGEISTSTSKLDARRCYSLGSCQYVIAESDLLVSLADGSEEADAGDKVDKTRRNGNSLFDGDVGDKRISGNSKGESFSVSKIWQWSKKGKLQSSSYNAR